MKRYRIAGGLALAAALAGLAACGASADDERVDETYRQESVAPSTPATETTAPQPGAVGAVPGDTTVSGQTPTVDRPRLPHGDDTMGAGAGTSVVPPGSNP